MSSKQNYTKQLHVHMININKQPLQMNFNMEQIFQLQCNGTIIRIILQLSKTTTIYK